KKESLPLLDLKIAMEAGPCGGVGLRYNRELLPRHICRDPHDICCRNKRQFRVATIDRSTHAAHKCGYFVAGLKFSSGCRNYLTHALYSADLRCLSPLAFTHMGFGVIYAKGFDRYQDLARFWFRVRQFLNHQTFKPTETV